MLHILELGTLFAECHCSQALEIGASSPIRFVMFPSYSFWIWCESFLCSMDSDSARLSNGDEMPDTTVGCSVKKILEAGEVLTLAVVFDAST